MVLGADVVCRFDEGITQPHHDSLRGQQQLPELLLGFRYRRGELDLRRPDTPKRQRLDDP